MIGERAPKEDVSTLDGTREAPPIPADDVALRRRIREYAREHGDRYSARLFDLWDEWNTEHFGGLMTPALILLDEPGQTQCYGQCSLWSGLAGCRSQIQLRPSILAGTLRDLRNGTKNPEGLRRFLEDVLLHEMIHQWRFEITREDDHSYSGHGPAFSAKANEIAARLGLPPVGRTCKKRDHEAKGLASPSQWPHNVRSADYYLGAHVPARRDKPQEDRCALCESAAASLARRFSVEEIRGIAEMAIRKKEASA